MVTALKVHVRPVEPGQPAFDIANVQTVEFCNGLPINSPDVTKRTLIVNMQHVLTAIVEPAEVAHPGGVSPAH